VENRLGGSILQMNVHAGQPGFPVTQTLSLPVICLNLTGIEFIKVTHDLVFYFKGSTDK
jgi:hypothetical protein